VRLALALALAGAPCAVASGATAAQDLPIELALPRQAAPNEAVWLQVRAGALPRGAEIVIRAHDGSLLGTVSPVGLRGSPGATTHLVPLPTSAVIDGRVRVRIAIEQAGAGPRAPRTSETIDVTLTYVPVTR
jgi:hypothetical protein